MLRGEGVFNMNRTKKIAILLGLAGLLLAVYKLPARHMAETEVLQALLKTTGASVTEGEVQFYALLDDHFREMAELEETMLEVADLLGLKGGRVQRGEGETYRVLDILGQTTFGSEAHIVVQSNPGSSDVGVVPQTYLLIVCRDAQTENLETMVQRINDLVLPYAPQGQVSVYLTGELPGKQTPDEMKRIASRALSALRATVVEGMYTDELISLTAYTPLLSEYVAIDGERFNLNLAVRYDDFHGKTVLWAGFPVIHTSY